MKMKTYIYKGQKKADSYLYIENEDDFSRIPQELLAVLGELSFVMMLELNKDRKLARLKVMQLMSELQENGFYLQMPDTSEPLPLAGMKPKSNPIPRV
jgi:uncharacterized protein YcgL (UPF0745 family)